MDLDLDDKDILNTSLDRKGFSSRQTRAKSAAAASAVSDEILVVSDHQPPSPMSKVHKDRQMNAKDYEETDEELDNAFAISKKMGDQSLMRGSQRGGGGPLEGKHSSTPKRSSKRVGGVASSVKSSISGYGISENDLVVDGEDDDDDVVELTKIDDAGSNVTEPGYVPPSILSTSPSKSSRRVQSIVKNVSSNNNNNYNHNKNARGDSGGESLPLSTFSSNRQLSSPAASSSAFVAHNSKFPLKPGSFAESVASALKDPYPVVINAMMDSYDSEEIFDAVADAAALATLEKSNAARGDELEPVQVDAAVLPEMFEEGHEITDLHRVQTQIMDEIERQKASKREEGCDIDVEGEEEMAPSSDKSTGKRR